MLSCGWLNQFLLLSVFGSKHVSCCRKSVNKVYDICTVNMSHKVEQEYSFDKEEERDVQVERIWIKQSILVLLLIQDRSNQRVAQNKTKFCGPFNNKF